MGGLFSRIWSLFASVEARIILLGLDNAGKTTILYKLARDEQVTTIPTLGFNVERIEYKKVVMEAWDIGGQERLRNLWAHYYKGSDAVIFVIDSNDNDRIEEAKDTLKGVLSDESLKEAKVLVFANKQDLPKAVKVDDLAKSLEMEKIANGKEWFIQPCTALKGEGLYEGLDWLSERL